MCERVKAIHKFYDNLEYNKIYDDFVPMGLSTLLHQMKLEDVKDVKDFSKRFLETACILEKNLSLFQSVCEHVDIATTIIEYLNHFGTQFMFGGNSIDTSNETALSIMFTLYNVCTKPEVQRFLEDAIIHGSTMDMNQLNCFFVIKSQMNEMILLDDSDLYAVINYLKISNNKSPLLSEIKRIWVQESIKQKFLWLVEKYLLYYVKNPIFPIYTFRSKQELLTPCTPNKINIVSIWSEDIIAAKNLAASLNRDVLFINTHMDFHGGVALLPYVEIFSRPLYKCSKYNLDNDYARTLKSDGHSRYSTDDKITNLFYDGMWQLPVKGTYWIHDSPERYDNVWATTTSEDINRCVNSATRGFKIWSMKSNESRTQILSKFASVLKRNGKFLLADTMSKWIKYLRNEKLSISTQNERLEITEIRKPRGIFVLKEKDETVLFSRLMSVLIAGNSVIVICDAYSCSIAPYCDMFSMSGVPPGVINLLLNEDTSDLETTLCQTDYTNYAKQVFSEDNLSTHMNLTLSKQIILPLK